MNPLPLAQQHLDRIADLAEIGLIAWYEVKMPKPEASRGFNGIAKVAGPQIPSETVCYNIMVVQANVVEAGGVVHEGMVMVSNGMIIHMDPTLADKLYHRAATQRN